MREGLLNDRLPPLLANLLVDRRIVRASVSEKWSHSCRSGLGADSGYPKERRGNRSISAFPLLHCRPRNCVERFLRLLGHESQSSSRNRGRAALRNPERRECLRSLEPECRPRGSCSHGLPAPARNNDVSLACPSTSCGVGADEMCGTAG